MYNPVIVTHYVMLARAVMDQYEKDVEKERAKLEKKKAVLINSLSTDSKYYNDKIRRAWKIWQYELNNFEILSNWINTPWGEFWQEAAETFPRSRHPMDIGIKTKRGLKND